MFKDKTFADDVVRTDGHTFRNCTFTRCIFQFEGKKLMRFQDCYVEDCHWGFTSYAGHTIDLLKQLAATGTKIDQFLQSQ